MKNIRLTFWGLVALCLILIGLANRDMVTLHAMPVALADAIGLSATIELPLFVILFLGVALGLIIGFLWEWMREHAIRADSRAKGREIVELKREMDRLRDADGDGQDDVLQLLDTRR